MLLPAFAVSVSPVMVLGVHQHKNSVKITPDCGAEKPSTSDVPVYCKIKYRRKACRTKKSGFQASAPDPTLKFPFLCDQQTKVLIQRSRIFFIMRGLPGSGKSTIVKTITSTFPSSVVCSADDYFLQDGVYKFDVAGLGSAHAACQEKAKEACQREVPVVIVDNTNVRRWEMKFYLDLASHTDYVVIPVQPKTSWRLNPEELATRNKHGVDVETMRRKVKQFDDVIPVYYAWFLRAAASEKLRSITQCLLEECAQKYPSFSDILMKHMHISWSEYQELQEPSDRDSVLAGLLKNYYTKRNKSGTIVHCTAKFCGGGRADGAKRYHAQPHVQNSVGQYFMLRIHSICFSPRTVGARVQLSEEQLAFFDKPEEKDWNGVQPRASQARGNGASRAAAKGRSDSQSSGKHSKNAKKKNSKPKTETDASSKPKTETAGDAGDQYFTAVAARETDPKRTKPLAKTFGRSAHITIACAHGFESRETNFDVLRLCDLEAGYTATDADFVPVTGGRARYFGDGVCCVYFDPPLYVKTIYSGFY